MGKIVKAVAKPITKIGSSLPIVGGLFKGGSQGQQYLEADPIAKDIFKTQKYAMGIQRQGLERLKEATKGDAGQIVRSRASREVKGIQGLAGDEARRVRDSLNRRGLGTTSLGQLANNSSARRAGERVASVQASIPERIEALKTRRAQALLAGSTGVIGSQNVPIRMRRQAIPKGPGKLGALGTLAGAGFGAMSGGGMQGAGMGAQLGGTLGNALG